MRTPERRVWLDAGKVEVVRFLRHVHNEQNEGP
jgi:hypothetical protein